MIIVFSRLQPFFQHSLFFLYLLGGFRSLSPTFPLFLHLVGILPFFISNLSAFSSFGWNSSVRYLQLFCFFLIWLEFFRSLSPSFLLFPHLVGILPFVISIFSAFSSFGWNSSVRHLHLFCFFLIWLEFFRSLPPTFLLFLHLVWNSSVRHLQLFCFFLIWLEFFRSLPPTFLLILHLGGFFDSSVVYYCPYRLTMPLLYPDATISFSLICTVTVPVSAVAKTLLPTFFNRSNVS